MSNFSQAVRQMQLEQLKCPACPAKNEPGKPPVIKVDIHNECWCSRCGAEFPIGDVK